MNIHRSETASRALLAANIVDDRQRISDEFSIQFSLRAGQCDAVWSPRTPSRREFEQVRAAYLRVRDRFCESIGEWLGVNVVVVEVPR